MKNVYKMGRLLYSDRNIAVFTRRYSKEGGMYWVAFTDLRNYQCDRPAEVTHFAPSNYVQIEEAKEANSLGLNVQVPEPIYEERVNCSSKEEFMEEVKMVYANRRFDLAEGEFVYPPSRFDVWRPGYDDQGNKMPDISIRELRAVIPGGIGLKYWLPENGYSGGWDWERRCCGKASLWEVLPREVVEKADQIQRAFSEACRKEEAEKTAARKVELAKKFGLV
jgi:hypothetical protein